MKVGATTGMPHALEKKKEKSTPFGVNLMRSQVLYRAAQNPIRSILVRIYKVQKPR